MKRSLLSLLTVGTIAALGLGTAFALIQFAQWAALLASRSMTPARGLRAGVRSCLGRHPVKRATKLLPIRLPRHDS